MKTRICLIIDDLDPGGAQHQLLELARRLPKNRFVCTIVSLSTQRVALRERFEATGAHVICIKQSGKWSWSCLWTLDG